MEVAQNVQRSVHSDQIKPYHHENITGTGILVFYNQMDPEERPAHEVDWVRTHRMGSQGVDYLLHWKECLNPLICGSGPTQWQFQVRNGWNIAKNMKLSRIFMKCRHPKILYHQFYRRTLTKSNK